MDFPSLKKNFGTDKAREADGTWVTNPGTGIRVRVRRTTHSTYKKSLRAHFKKVRHLAGNMPPELELDLKMKAASDALVTDWQVDGVPFSPANVLEAFKEYPDFYEWVEGEAENFENFRLEAVEEDAGPLSHSSDGSENGAIQRTLPSSNDAQPAEIPLSPSSADPT